MKQIGIKTPEEMESFGAQLAQQLYPPCQVLLKGELGAGKTTLVRGLLRGLSYSGVVKSPTYTLVESYTFPDKIIHHFDLYRLKSKTELEMMGFFDYFDDRSICLIEWPEIAEAYLKGRGICCTIDVVGDVRQVSLLTKM